MNILKELEFIDKIDGNFPYGNFKDCLKLIDEAISISPNSVFAVVEEICRIPDEDRITVAFLALKNLLNEVEKKFKHPLKEMVLKIANRMLAEQETTLEETLINLELVRKFPRQFASLNIIYYSCHGDEKKLNDSWNSIIKEWDSLNV